MSDLLQNKHRHDYEAPAAWQGAVGMLLARRKAPALSHGGGVLLLLDTTNGTTRRTFLTFHAGRILFSVDEPLDPNSETTIVLGRERDWEALLLAGDATALRRLRFYGDPRPLKLLAQVIRRADTAASEMDTELWQ